MPASGSEFEETVEGEVELEYLNVLEGLSTAATGSTRYLYATAPSFLRHVLISLLQRSA